MDFSPRGSDECSVQLRGGTWHGESVTTDVADTKGEGARVKGQQHMEGCCVGDKGPYCVYVDPGR